MTPEFAAYLERHSPAGEGNALWLDGRLPLRLVSYFTEEPPPLEFVTSVRCIVFRGDEVLVLRNRHSVHIVPGGRREPGETPAQTLERELLEETGWKVTEVRQLAVVHFHGQAPEPPPEASRFPYPDFLQTISTGEAVSYHPEAKIADDYELEAEFHLIGKAQQLDLTPDTRLLHEAALRRRAAPAPLSGTTALAR